MTMFFYLLWYFSRLQHWPSILQWISTKRTWNATLINNCPDLKCPKVLMIVQTLLTCTWSEVVLTSILCVFEKGFPHPPFYYWLTLAKTWDIFMSDAMQSFWNVNGLKAPNGVMSFMNGCVRILVLTKLWSEKYRKYWDSAGTLWMTSNTNWLHSI